jgi:hypothetical protein
MPHHHGRAHRVSCCSWWFLGVKLVALSAAVLRGLFASNADRPHRWCPPRTGASARHLGAR